MKKYDISKRHKKSSADAAENERSNVALQAGEDERNAEAAPQAEADLTPSGTEYKTQPVSSADDVCDDKAHPAGAATSPANGGSILEDAIANGAQICESKEVGNDDGKAADCQTAAEVGDDKTSDDIQDIEEAPRPLTDVETGLSSAEVEQRIAEGKVNGDTEVKTKSVFQIFFENICTFFNFIFVALAVLICFFVDWKNDFFGAIGNFGFIILIVVNTCIGIFQELRAKHTIDKLTILSAPKVTVLRDGEQKEIAVRDIVLDDIVILSAGSQICADSVVREGTIEVNESLITGEPDAILKAPGDKIMSGSFVVSGKAKSQVEHIGAQNFAAKITAGAKYFKKPNSEIWRSLMFVVKVMAIVIIPVGIALFLVKYFLQSGSVLNGGTITLNQYVVTTIGTVIGMIPSGLVALSSTVFCVSVLRLSKRKILAQDMYCVETLARVDILCLDKTGTITEGSMEVNGLSPKGRRSEEELRQIIKDFTAAVPDDNATICALRNYTDGLDVVRTAVKCVPFSSQRKYSGVRFEDETFVLGAPEFVLGALQGDIKDEVESMASEGYRVMVLTSSKADFDGTALPASLALEAFIFITDKIRAEAPDTLRFFKEEGVNVKIISGDNPETVRAVAKRAGLENCDNIIDMSTLKTEEEVKDAALKYTVFGRVLPDQKLLLVNALKSAGHTVAMTGDGVNDVLALKASDCSIAMSSGSDAAKNVSSLVLLDSNFASMPKVVAEGRRSINNLERSAALYLMKTIYNTLLAILFMFFANPLPFSPQNLTLMGGVTIGMPSIVLALEPNDDRVEGRFLPKVLVNAIPGGITVLLAAIAVIIGNKFFLAGLTASQARNVFIIVITFVGFMLLAKVSFPFTWLHLATYIVMVGLFVACYLVPLPGDVLAKFFGIDQHLTAEMGKAIAAICAVLVPIYALLCTGMHFYKKRTYTFWEQKFEKLDNRMRKLL